jgi:hypothetical protein
MPARGRWTLRCDCGWEGHTAQHEGLRARGRDEVEEALDGAFLAHLGPNERQTYLLVDSRPPPPDWVAPDDRPTIVGVFVMPEAVPVMLKAHRVDDGVHHGTFVLDGVERELPIGEVRTPGGEVFRLDQ